MNGAEEMLAIDRLVQQDWTTISAIASCVGTMSLKPDAPAKPVATPNSFAGASGLNASNWAGSIPQPVFVYSKRGAVRELGITRDLTERLCGWS